ncbi:MAG: MmgE/PrpD family protein [Rhodovibrionaceae bacterium]
MKIEAQPAAVLAWNRSLAFEDLPGEVVLQAKRCLLDLIGVAAAGVRTPSAAIAGGIAQAQMAAGPAKPAARLLLDGTRVSPAGAAYAGAVAIDSFDAHDGHPLTKGHAGVAVLPALLAYADAAPQPPSGR